MDQLFGLQHRRDIHPYQTSPYMGRLNRSACRSYIKVSSTHQRVGLDFFIGWRSMGRV